MVKKVAQKISKEAEELEALSDFVVGKRVEENSTDDAITKELASFFVPGIRGEIVPKYYEVPLGEILSIKGLIEYLLGNHTFIYGKVGFYKLILDTIHSVAEINPGEIIYLKRSADFQKKNILGKRVILTPAVSNDNALNSFITQALNKRLTVWVISYPSTMAKHVMLNFHNFFIASGTETEIKPLRDIVRMSDEDYSYLTGVYKGGALFVSDFGVNIEYSFVKRIRIM